jgi:pyruvate/2-oxoglutarate dehydrogenase complex dihydrolipoamide acyltransferase (E2) component
MRSASRGLGSPESEQAGVEQIAAAVQLEALAEHVLAVALEGLGAVWVDVAERGAGLSAQRQRQAVRELGVIADQGLVGVGGVDLAVIGADQYQRVAAGDCATKSSSPCSICRRCVSA